MLCRLLLSFRNVMEIQEFLHKIKCHTIFTTDQIFCCSSTLLLSDGVGATCYSPLVNVSKRNSLNIWSGFSLVWLDPLSLKTGEREKRERV